MAAIAVYLCSAGHMVLLAHATCAHGDVVHEPHAHGALADDARGHETETAISSEAPDGHDHCQGSGVMPALPAVAPAFAPATLLDAALLPDGIRSSAEVRALSVLSLAPKSSPPV